jgi:hypothetical protein
MAMHVEQYITIDQLPAECITACTGGGRDAAPYAREWRERLGLTVDRAKTIACLRGYGAWDDAELNAKSDDELAEIVLWLACGSFAEWDGTDDSPCGSDIFALE